MSDKIDLPKYDELYVPMLATLKALGGSGSIEEINGGVFDVIKPTEVQLAATYPKSGALILPDRMSWARSFLKAAGLIDRASRGVWILTPEGRAVTTKSAGELKKIVTAKYKTSVAAKKAAQEEEDEIAPEDGSISGWADLLLARLQSIDPAAFERLCQRILRESGFIRVDVTGKTGDGGIDGVGVLRMTLVSFKVLFQCKRYKGSVGAPAVRDFRGAMQGRADKGLIITTGVFTQDAQEEAARDGAPAIDLIDGKTLCSLLKDLRVGVTVSQRVEEDVALDEPFFANL